MARTEQLTLPSAVYTILYTRAQENGKNGKTFFEEEIFFVEFFVFLEASAKLVKNFLVVSWLDNVITICLMSGQCMSNSPKAGKCKSICPTIGQCCVQLSKG